MEHEPEEKENLDTQVAQSDEDFYQLTMEVIKKNSIYTNLDAQFNQIFLK